MSFFFKLFYWLFNLYGGDNFAIPKHPPANSNSPVLGKIFGNISLCFFSSSKSLLFVLFLFSEFDGVSFLFSSSLFPVEFNFIDIYCVNFSFSNSIFSSDAVISSIVISVFPTFALVFAFNLISKISFSVACLLIMCYLFFIPTQHLISS